MKKILVLGVGAQGSTAARKLDAEPEVGEIIAQVSYDSHYPGFVTFSTP